MINGHVYREQTLSPFDDSRSCGSIGGKGASVGTGKGTSLSEALEGLVDGLDTTGPVKMRGLVSVSEGIFYTIQDDPANAVGEH